MDSNEIYVNVCREILLEPLFNKLDDAQKQADDNSDHSQHVALDLKQYLVMTRRKPPHFNEGI